MYAAYFGLRHEPFSLAPDPRFLFMSERHREALAHLLYGLGGAGGGFVLLSGEIGAGKTTVCRCFLEQLPAGCNVAYIFNPKLEADELLQTVCDEFGADVEPGSRPDDAPASPKRLTDRLNGFLLRAHAAGQNNILIVDEAQMLSGEVLEQLRLLTNLETNERKLLQIVLIGQPELRDLLARPELEQLAQRVVARFHLGTLSEAETLHYVQHRLDVAGLQGASPFEAAALKRLHRLSRGVPRRINLLADRALLGAYASGSARVTARIVERAAREVFDDGVRRHGAPAWALGALGALGGATLVVAAGAAWLRVGQPGGRPAIAQPSAGVPSAAASQAASSPTAAAASASAPDPPVAAIAAPGGRTGATNDPQPAFKSLIGSEQQAWRQLASSWNLDLPDGGTDACEAALRRQLRCFKGSTSLTVIRQLDRPGFVTLYDDNGAAAYALLTGLGGDAVTLRVGGEERRVSLTALASMWRGDFATLWRTPPGFGSRGGGAETGRWLSQQLARLQGGPQPLKAAVAAFQLTQGLKPDGVAGPVTLMQINRAAAIDEPRLAPGS